MYSWIRDTLIPSVFSGGWYNDELPRYPGFIDNHESFLVSIPRLRQVRVKKGMPYTTHRSKYISLASHIINSFYYLLSQK